MRLAATAAAIVVLAGCVSPPQSGPNSRNLTYGLFYDFFRPDSSRDAELQARIGRPIAPEIDEDFDIGRIRAARQYSEVAENYELRDWKDGVLLRADADLLRRMRGDTAAQVGHLERKLARLEREPVSLRKGRIEPVRHQLDTERTKLDEIDGRLEDLE